MLLLLTRLHRRRPSPFPGQIPPTNLRRRGDDRYPLRDRQAPELVLRTRRLQLDGELAVDTDARAGEPWPAWAVATIAVILTTTVVVAAMTCAGGIP